MAQDLLLGIDIGTYESKGVLTTTKGEVIAQEAIPHKLLFPRAGWAEHDPEATWWEISVIYLKTFSYPWCNTSRY